MEFEKLKSLLECPVCFETASQPIFNCPNGHIICRVCAPKLRICPVCRSPVVHGSRNIVAERLASECDFPCRYSNNGCNVIAKGNDVAYHEIECDYRPIKCMVRLCKEHTLANFLQYYEHLSLSHGIPEAPKNQAIWERDLPVNKVSLVKEATKKPGGMMCYGERFIQCLDSDDHNVWIWVAICGPFSKDNVHSFEVTLKIQSYSDNLEISWTGPVHNIRDSSREILSSGLCLLTNKTVLKRFLEEKQSGDSTFRLQIILKLVKKIEIGSGKKTRDCGKQRKSQSDLSEATIVDKLMKFFACGKN